VIRRGFWLILGVVLGVTGYRRAGQLARVILPGRHQLGGTARAAGGTAAFLRDVRDGMDTYLDPHPGRGGHTLEGQQVPGQRPASRGGPRAAAGIDYSKDGR
jgi:hypothetical protein